MEYFRVLWIALVFVAFAGIPLALIYFTVKMTSNEKSWMKFFVDVVAFSIGIAIIIAALGQFIPIAVPIALAIAYVRHTYRPSKSDLLSDKAGQESEFASAGASDVQGNTSLAGDSSQR